ncbi:winged helix-turn-helix transcriptional regulator [Candidatus Woesearchaeota archaeon]|nr:winged helix-turn-helix transcriptional regulator [Candidatus Woesearchaeota archaeon]
MAEEFFDEGKKKVLELDARRKIYDIVRKFAGCHFREIERKSGLSTGSIKYHLSYLTKHGLIKEERDGNNLRYYPNEFGSEDKKLLGLLRQKSIRKIVLFILTHNNCNHKQIVQFVGLSPSTVSWHLKKLEESNIIGFAKKGRKTAYGILIDKGNIINLLITYRESFLDSVVDRVIDMWELS